MIICLATPLVRRRALFPTWSVFKHKVRTFLGDESLHHETIKDLCLTNFIYIYTYLYLFSIEWPLAVHGLVSGVDVEDDFVSNVAAKGVVEFNWEGSWFFVVFLSIGQFFEKFTEILDSPFKGDSVVFSWIGGFKGWPNILDSGFCLGGDREFLHLFQISTEGSIFFENSLIIWY